MNDSLKEIERKYLAGGGFREMISSSYRIKQGYLSRDKERIVRVRITDDSAYITIKGKQTGITRFEWEKEIGIAEAGKLISMALPGIIDKTRHVVCYKDQKFEVDEFHGLNSGLVIAEIELESEQAVIELPAWIIKDVSDDIRYSNSYLSEHPFSTW